MKRTVQVVLINRINGKNCGIHDAVQELLIDLGSWFSFRRESLDQAVDLEARFLEADYFFVLAERLRAGCYLIYGVVCCFGGIGRVCVECAYKEQIGPLGTAF